MVSKVVLAFLAAVGLVNCLPSGAPPSSCVDLTPGHGLGGQTSLSPFMTMALSDTVQAGETVDVMLHAMDSTDTFRGYLILAQPEGAETFEGIGTFTSVSNGQIGSCLNQTDNYATHIDTSAKNEVTVTWRAPVNFSGAVVFRTTFAETAMTYWIATTSTRVTVTQA